jgi:hypothetical protein
MKPQTLRLLERLERRAVDEHRQQLAELERRLQAAGDALKGLRAARPVETAIGWDMGQGAGAVAAFWAGSRAAETELLAHVEALRREQAAVVEAMRLRLAEARRYELLAEAELDRARAEAARQSQTAIDEAVLVRRAADRAREDGGSGLRTSAPMSP